MELAFRNMGKTDEFVSSLTEQCMFVVCEKLNSKEDWEILKNLPPSLKAELLRLLCNRKMINEENIDVFVDKSITEFRLCSGILTNRLMSKLCLFRNLSTLDLSRPQILHPSMVSPEALCTLFWECRLMKIVYLDYVIALTDFCVEILTQRCRFLRQLSINGCRMITDASLVAVAENCQFLECFDFSRTGVTDAGVKALANGRCAPTLKEVYFNGCYQVTDNSVEALFTVCRRLRILSFLECPLLTQRSSEMLEQLTNNANSNNNGNGSGRSRKVKQISWTVRY